MKNTQEFQKFYDLGYNDNSIALETNSKPYTVGKWRRNNNLKVNRLIDRYGTQIKEMVSKNMTNNQIAKILPISGPHLFKIRMELGIPASPYKRIIWNTPSEKIKARILRRTRSHAKQRNIEFKLELKDIILSDTCPLLEIKLNYHSGGSKSNSASVDRIDNNKGYIPGNVKIISFLANSMKYTASKEELIIFSKNISNYFRKT